MILLVFLQGLRGADLYLEIVSGRLSRTVCTFVPGEARRAGVFFWIVFVLHTTCFCSAILSHNILHFFAQNELSVDA